MYISASDTTLPSHKQMDLLKKGNLKKGIDMNSEII